MSAEQLKTQGNTALQQGRYTDAIALFTKAISLTPTAIYYSNRALCYLKLQNFASALKDTTKSLELDPNYAKNLQRHAEALIRLNKLDQAVKIAEKLFNAEQTTKNRELLNEANRAFDIVQNYEKRVKTAASHIFKLNGTLCEKFATSPVIMTSSKDRADNLDKADEFQKAICVVEQAAFDERESLDQLGAKSLQDDMKFIKKTVPSYSVPQEVISFYNIVMQAFRNSCDSLVQFGCNPFVAEDDVLNNKKYFIQQAERSVNQMSNSVNKLVMQACVELLNQNTNNVVALFQKIVQQDEKYKVFVTQYQSYLQHKDLGTKAFTAKNYNDAITHFVAAIQAVFDFKALSICDPETLDSYVSLLFLSSQFLSAQAFSNLAMCYSNTSNLPLAIQFFNCATFLDLNYSKAHLRAAKIFLDAKMFKEAEDSYSQAASVDPAQNLKATIQQINKQLKPYLRKDYYALLGIAKNTVVDSDDYNKCYKKQAAKNHPDRFARDPVMKRFAEWKFRLIQEADSVMRDKNKKIVYDQGGDPINDPEAGMGGMSGGMGGVDISQMFGSMFGGMGGGNVQFTVNGQPQGGRRGRGGAAGGMPPGMGDMFSQFFGGM